MPPPSLIPALQLLQPNELPLPATIGNQLQPPAATGNPVTALPGAHILPRLPNLNAGDTVVPAAMFMGDGLVPVPERIVAKILKLEFVEMQDLIPETWSEGGPSEEFQKFFGKRRRAPVTDILRWVQCFAAMVSVLSQHHSNLLPEFMAYLAIIVKCQHDYEGIGWLQYDRAFRRQAAVSKDLHWSRINTSLFSLCFTGKARARTICQICMSSDHATAQCPEGPYGSCWPLGFGQPPNAQTAPPYPSSGPALAKSSGRRSRDICGLFNSRSGPATCTYKACKFVHVCSECRGQHPRPSCPNLAPAAKKQKSTST